MHGPPDPSGRPRVPTATVLPLLYVAVIGLASAVTGHSWLTDWITALSSTENLGNAFLLLAVIQAVGSAFTLLPVLFVVLGALHGVGALYIEAQGPGVIGDLAVLPVLATSLIPFALIQIAISAARWLLLRSIRKN